MGDHLSGAVDDHEIGAHGCVVQNLARFRERRHCDIFSEAGPGNLEHMLGRVGGEYVSLEDEGTRSASQAKSTWLRPE